MGILNKFSLIIFITLYVMVVVIPVSSSTNTSGVFNIHESHGTTWIRWEWRIPSNYTFVNSTYMRVLVDDKEKYNMSMDDIGNITTEYTLSDVNPNEYHKLELRYISLAVPNIECVIAFDTLVVKTDLPFEYYLFLFIISSGLIIVSLMVRNNLIALMMTVFSFVIYLYVAFVSINSTATLSTISIIMAIIAAFLCVYYIYGMYKRYVLKEVVDV